MTEDDVKYCDAFSYCILMSFDIAGCRKRNMKTSKKLMSTIKGRREGFYIGWQFSGVKHYVKILPDISDVARTLLIDFFIALEGDNRDQILEKLKPLKRSWFKELFSS